MSYRDHEFLTNLICCELRDGNSLAKIAKICEVSLMEVVRLVSLKTRLSDDRVKAVFNMMSQGASIERISRNTKIPSEVLETFVPPRKGCLAFIGNVCWKIFVIGLWFILIGLVLYFFSRDKKFSLLSVPYGQIGAYYLENGDNVIAEELCLKAVRFQEDPLRLRTTSFPYCTTTLVWLTFETETTFAQKAIT
mmetsp:Transcript_12296/g.23332  ORF Transcript_12296/g.23332 Transcript_12296/m.23332 type:complete len:193 (+) Transcript_12296:88-666(+)